MLFASSIMAAIGLFLLSQAEGAVPTFAAATVFAVGVCYFWPTMLGFVAERMPKTGALGLSTMGGAGMLAVSFVLPIMGRAYDTKIDAAIPEGYTREQISAAGADPAMQTIWNQVQADGGAATLALVAALPLVLIVVFGAIYFTDRAKGGYKAERLGGVEAAGDPGQE